MENNYSITWHFEGTTLSSFYVEEELRDKAFEEIRDNLTKGVQWHCLGDTIINSNKALCITKGDTQEWKSVKSH